MINPVIAFENVAWETTAPGARVKAVVVGKRRLRLVEFDVSFVEPNWCTRGHLGMVVSGTMELEMVDRVVTFKPGDGVCIPDGEEHRHRHHRSITTTTLFLVEDV